MQFTISILLLMLAIRTGLAGIVANRFEPDEVTSLVETAVHIVKFCYENQITTVGLVGDSPEILIKELSSQVLLTVTLIGNTTRIGDNKPASKMSIHRLQVFVITEAFLTELEALLKEIKDSLWWNHMASFLVLANPNLMHGCLNAFEVLKTAWNMDILHAKYICLHPTKGRLIYAFNPFTDYAPKPWKLDNTYNGPNDHPWTLLVRNYRNDSSTCEQLDFDVTTNLGGYQIRSIAKNVPESFHFIPNKTGIDAFDGFSGVTARIIFKALNATPKLILHTGSNGFSHDRARANDIAMEIMSGNSDIGLNFRDQLVLENLTRTYPHWYGGLGAVTQYSGYESHFSKFQSLVDVKSQYAMYLIVLITLAFFKCFRNRSLIPAILDTLRIMFNSSLTNLPTDEGSRIYLASLFIFSIIFGVYYQGQLTSLLMERLSLPNVNTKQDLAESGHKIYGYKLYSHFFNEPAFKNRFVKLDDLECSLHVLADSSVACMMERQLIIDEAVNFGLHLSSDTIMKIAFIYVIRPNWPLEQRLNKLLASLTEGDIIGHTSMKKYRIASSVFEFNAKLKKSEKYKVITLEELYFSFVILAIGLACATVIFIIELSLQRSIFKIKNVLNRLRNKHH